jgi:anaerobic magnesium-protoporphyrin IX monomethyl ester cyclase
MPSGTRADVFDAEVADLLFRSGCRALAFAPESGSPEILKVIKKQVDLGRMLESMRIAVRRGLKLSCFIVIGFPDDTPATLRQTTRLIRKMAWLGVYDVAVSKFVPYPGSELFTRLQTEGKVQLDDDFFVSPMDFYTQKAPSYADAISTRRLYWTMMWMFWNFYLLSFVFRPLRVLRTLVKAVTTGAEDTRYAKWFVDRFYTRRRWRKLAKPAHR